MKEEDIVTVVQILSSDPRAVKNWRMLYDKLELPPADAEILKQRSNTSYELFREIIQNWKCSKGKEAKIESLTNILKANGFNDCADSISNQVSFTNDHFKIKHNYQEPVANYISRPDLEQEIVNVLQTIPTNNGQINFPIVILQGIGGNGKTTLARKVVKLCEENNYFGGSSVWIDAEYEENIITEFLNILNIKKDENVEASIKKELANMFCQQSFLLVFDNVDNYQNLIKYLPLNLKTNISVLITSNAVWESGDFGEVKHIPIDKFTNEEFYEFAKCKIKNVTYAEVEILAEYTGRFPYLANIVLSGAAIWKKRHVGIEINQYLNINDSKFIKGVKSPRLDYLIYKRSSHEIVERQINLIKEYYEEDGAVAYKMLCILAYCHSGLTETNFRNIISAHEGFKVVATSRCYQAIKQAVNVGARILVQQGFLQIFRQTKQSDDLDVNKYILEDSKNSGDSDESENENQIVNFDQFDNENLAPSIHRSHRDAVQKILQRRGKERNEIEQILNFELKTNEDTFDVAILFRLGINYGNDILKLMFDSSHFLYNLVRYDVADGVKELVNYAKKTKTEQEYLDWVLFNRQLPETIKPAQRLKMLFGLNWKFFEVYFEDFEDFFKKMKPILKDSEMEEIFATRDFVWKSLQFDNFDWMDLVLENYPNFIHSKIGSNHESFLFIAIANDNLGATEYFIKRGVELNFQNKLGETPLLSAVLRGKQKIIESLLKAGSDPNILNEFTPLSFAVLFSNVDVVKCLLSYKADPNNTKGVMWKLLIYATLQNNLDIVQVLLEGGADPNIQDEYGKTPLHYAVVNRKLDFVKLLIAYHADVNIKNINGQTALYFSDYILQPNMVKFLLNNNADPNNKDNYGNTLLHYVARKNAVEFAKILLSNGANPDIKNYEGLTSLDLSKKYKVQEMIQLLDK